MRAFLVGINCFFAGGNISAHYYNGTTSSLVVGLFNLFAAFFIFFIYAKK